MLELNQIRIDGGTQSRVELNQETVAEYAQAFTAGASFPAVVVFFDGVSYWLADGFHRYFGARDAGEAAIDAEIIKGTQRDAVLYSLKANATHGLKRTNADKRKAVQTLLADPEWAAWSDRKIAEVCGVGHPFVAAIRTPAIAAKQQENRAANAAKKAQPVESDSTPVHAPTPTPSPGSQAEQHDEPEDDGPSAAEIAANVAAEAADRASFNKFMEADDKLATAVAEVKRLNAELAAVKVARDGYMNQNAELIRTIKSLQRRLDRAERTAA